MPEPTEDELRAAARSNERLIQTTRDRDKRLEAQIVNQRIYDSLDRQPAPPPSFSTAGRPPPRILPNLVPSMNEEEESPEPSGPSDEELREAARANERLIQVGDKSKRLDAQMMNQKIYDELEKRGRTRERGGFF